MANIVEKNKVIELDFVITNSKGEILDQSEGNEPMVYLHGAGDLLDVLEEALEGKSIKDAINLKVSKEDAYGEIDESLIIRIPKQAIEHDAELAVGEEFELEMENGEVEIFTVIKVDAEEYLVDGNHPFAGIDLVFSLEIKRIREATEKEIEQGYPDEQYLH